MNTQMKSLPSLAIAGAISAIGLVVGSIALAWVAGSLSISTAAATQIVDAVEVGGLALTLVAAAFGFGIGGAVVATIRYYLTRKAKGLAIA